MIKRLVITPKNHRKRVWLEGGEPDTGSMFSPRTTLPRITVMIDVELLADPPPSPFTEPELFNVTGQLSGLLLHRYIKLYRFADDGPPSDAELVLHDFGKSVYRGWVELQPLGEGHQNQVVTYESEEGHYTTTGIFGNSAAIAANDYRSTAYIDLEPEAASNRRKLDELAAQVAEQGVHADIYVTRREYLYSKTYHSEREVTICTPEEALTLVSLYLREQGEFIAAIPGPRDTLNMNRGLFYWVGTRELLPAAWRWISACAQHAQGSGDDRLTYLGQSLLQRFGRALEARDRIHLALNQPQDNDLKDHALADLDVVLVLLMATVDITARVSHAALGITNVGIYRAGWQRTDWLAAVKAKSPGLASIVASDTENFAVLTVLRLLRNSVHGIALQGITVVRGTARPTESRIGLPQDDEALLLEAMNYLGGSVQWGVERHIPGQTHLEPATFVDRLFHFIVPLLNDLMNATPVEGLEYVCLTPELSFPPRLNPSGGWNPFDEWTRNSICWQLGF